MALDDLVRELTDAPPDFSPLCPEVKFYYGTQTDVAPPIFVIFTNQPKGVSESYTRYLLNGFRQRWGFTGSPVWLRFRGRRED